MLILHKKSALNSYFKSTYKSVLPNLQEIRKILASLARHNCFEFLALFVTNEPRAPLKSRLNQHVSVAGVALKCCWRQPELLCSVSAICGQFSASGWDQLPWDSV